MEVENASGASRVMDASEDLELTTSFKKRKLSAPCVNHERITH